MMRTVLKFGGTSLSDFDKIRNISKYLKKRISNGEQLIVVVSAMGKTTDVLLENVKILTKKPSDRDLALLLTTGEQQTISYLSFALQDIGVKTTARTGFQLGIQTSGHLLKSKILKIDETKFEQDFKSYDCIVVAGFQGISDTGLISTLGRGGSDTTAVAIASTLSIPCEIYTDVDGVYSTDPRIYKDAIRLDEVSFEEMMEMSALGAGVLETRSIEIAMNHGIPIYLGRTLSNEKGTWIMPKEQILERKAVTGVALDADMLYVTLSYPMYDEGLISELFDYLEVRDVNIDMISQIVNLDGLQLSFTMKNTEINELEELFEKLKKNYHALLFTVLEDYSKVSIIGSGMRDMSGVASKAFKTLLKSKVKFYQVTTSEISISYVINETHGTLAVNELCKAFNI